MTFFRTLFEAFDKLCKCIRSILSPNFVAYWEPESFINAAVHLDTLQGCNFCIDSEKSIGQCVPGENACPQAFPEVVQDSCPSKYLPLVIVGIVIYLAAFSPGLGPVPWSVNAEIFPPEVTTNPSQCPGHWHRTQLFHLLMCTKRDIAVRTHSNANLIVYPKYDNSKHGQSKLFWYCMHMR